MSDILEVRNLYQSFDLTSGLLDKLHLENGRISFAAKSVRAVSDVSFNVGQGEVFSLVGESGCGKSTTARTVIRLLKPKGGSIVYRGNDITHLKPRDMLPYRREIQMIFQDPYASLNPRQKVKDILGEAMMFHKIVSTGAQALEKSIYLLEKVGLSAEQAGRYPHQFSGGQRQRIGIARALCIDPKLIIADEPVSALDVSIQAQILNILMDLKDEFGLSYLFIAHNLSVVEHISDSLGVMYLGTIVEKGTRDSVFTNPLHPYTKLLFSAVPDVRRSSLPDISGMKGEIPSPVNMPSGCPFHDRCVSAMPICSLFVPDEHEPEPGHKVRCHLFSTGSFTQEGIS